MIVSIGISPEIRDKIRGKYPGLTWNERLELLLSSTNTLDSEETKREPENIGELLDRVDRLEVSIKKGIVDGFKMIGSTLDSNSTLLLSKLSDY